MCLQIAQINCALWRPVTLRNWTQHKAACWWPHSLLSTPSVSETFIFLEWAKPVVCTHIYIYICVCVCVCVCSVTTAQERLPTHFSILQFLESVGRKDSIREQLTCGPSLFPSCQSCSADRERHSSCDCDVTAPIYRRATYAVVLYKLVGAPAMSFGARWFWSAT